MTPAIVHLIGFPGAGKYTIAQELARQATTHLVVIDNHFTANVIFGVMEVDGIRVLPEQVWDRVEEVREAVFRTIETLSPRDWSFVLTNVLSEGFPRDAAAVARLSRLARTTNRRYLPVRLHCALDELLTRVPSDERRARLKWVDPEAVRRYATERELIDVSNHNPLELDVTHTSPENAAAAILDHLSRR